MHTFLIGRGSFASVSKGKLLGENVVIKILHRNLLIDGKAAFSKEATLLGSIKHKNIVKLLGVCEKPSAGIIMEYSEFSFAPFGRDASFNNLDEWLNYVDEQDILKYFSNFGNFIARDISDGLNYLHSNDMVHRDIKPSNILVTNSHYDSENVTKMLRLSPIICKLADLGEGRSKVMQTKTLSVASILESSNEEVLPSWLLK